MGLRLRIQLGEGEGEGMETATLDPETDKYVAHPPILGTATKWWPGGGACLSLYYKELLVDTLLHFVE